MPEFQWLVTAFPNFVRYVVVGFGLAGLFLLIYVMVTPWREFRLIRAGNTSAAIALIGALLGFCLPLANTIAHSVSLVDVVLWSLVALAVQVIVHIVMRLLLPDLKQAIVRSDGHDTVLTEIPDIASGHVWPGAMARAQRNAFVERWMGREWALRQNQREAGNAAAAARRTGDADNAPMLFGQDAGLIASVEPAAKVIADMVAEAEDIIGRRLHGLLKEPFGSHP
jgi:uncharacterized membrane protein YjfL (UPF0719 family)